MPRSLPPRYQDIASIAMEVKQSKDQQQQQQQQTAADPQQRAGQQPAAAHKPPVGPAAPSKPGPVAPAPSKSIAGVAQELYRAIFFFVFNVQVTLVGLLPYVGEWPRCRWRLK